MRRKQVTIVSGWQNTMVQQRSRSWPEVLIAAIAENTKTIKVGSGAVLLNHYSVFKVAEVFCTLNELYPGRIDLGAGRATTGPVTDYALQQDRSMQFQSDSNQQIAELVAWLDNSFEDDHPFSKSPIRTIDSIPQLNVLDQVMEWFSSGQPRFALCDGGLSTMPALTSYGKLSKILNPKQVGPVWTNRKPYCLSMRYCR